MAQKTRFLTWVAALRCRARVDAKPSPGVTRVHRLRVADVYAILAETQTWLNEPVATCVEGWPQLRTGGIARRNRPAVATSLCQSELAAKLVAELVTARG